MGECNYFEAFEENESDDANHVYQFPVYLSLCDALKPKYLQFHQNKNKVVCKP